MEARTPQNMSREELIAEVQRLWSGDEAGASTRQELTLCEEEIRLGAERLRLAQAAGRVGVWDYDPQQRELTWSQEQSHILGMDSGPMRVSCEQWLDFIHPDDRERVAEQLGGHGADEIDIEYRIVRSDGQVRWVNSRGKAIQESVACRRRVIGVTIDVTENKDIQRRLQELNESLAEQTRQAEERSVQLRALASELTQAENRERRRLAMLLHDHLQQLLIALRMKISLVKHQPHPDSSDPLLTQSVTLLDEAITASRSLSVQLSPPMLYDSGLPAALEWLAEQMREKHGLEVEVNTAGEPEDEDIRAFLFHCVRELLFNVVKHAASPRAEVRMWRSEDDEQIVVMVRDFGKGMDSSASLRTRQSFGLLGIRERLGWLGGRLEIDSEPGRGLKATLIAPIRKPTETQ